MSPAAFDYEIRRFRPDDAPGVTDLVREVYGEGYNIHAELYDPRQVAALNERGELVSIVAADAAGRVVGHYALECSPALRVAETGEAMVAPEHRHHGLLDRMRPLIEREASRRGLLAMFGRCVTTHTFSQQTEVRAGGRPCSLSLGRSPRSLGAAGQGQDQRVSTVMYAKLLEGRPARPLHAPARHREMIAHALGQLGISAVFAETPSGAEPPTRFEIDLRADLGRITLRATQVGADFAAALRRSLAEALGTGAVEVAFLDLPLAQPGTAAAALDAEAEGFFFSGVAPAFFADGDALRLQRLLVDLDVARLQLFEPFALELRDYVSAERRRVSGQA